MRTRIRGPALLVGALALAASVLATGALAENVDPGDDGSQFVWAENAGWVNAEPANCSDCGVEVTDTELTGWMWGENVGWVSMNCSNNGTCGTVDYGVTNDGAGNLAGYAWSENAGWISFSCANQSSCGAVDYGVTVDGASGEFAGYAWAENAGWVSFSCANQSSCGTVDYGVRTEWIENTLLGMGVVVLPGSGVTLTFDNVTGAGETTATTSNTGPLPPDGFQLGSPAIFYDISTTATFTGNVKICINYIDTYAMPFEKLLRLFHREGGMWIDVTNDDKPPPAGNPDTANDILCGVVTSFSEFVPAELVPGQDFDGDGCSNDAELQIDPGTETTGGLRNPLNPHDFYDVAGSPGPPQNGAPDGVIDLPNDILGVIQHHPAGTLGYDAQFDRGPWTGPNSWNDTQGPDGVIDLPNDILGVILQFSHSCQ